jgi:uridine phosphorylase
MSRIPESELIINPDGSIFHLHLLPEDIADTIILVGDMDRVKEVSSFFDKIELKKQNREFITHTGIFRSKRITVVSTGIGTDNIRISALTMASVVFGFSSTKSARRPNTFSGLLVQIS